MSPPPHHGPEEEGLSSSLLQIVEDEDKVEALRAVLSGFCHRCRNSLNGIKLSLYIFRHEPRGTIPACWDEIESIYQQIEQLFDRFHTIYHPMKVTVIRATLADLIGQHAARWKTRLESRGLALRLDPPRAEVAVDLDPAQLGVGLDALATWRAEVGRPGGVVRLDWGFEDRRCWLRWREWPRPEQVGGAARHPADGGDRDGRPNRRRVDSLALPLLSRIVAAHGGRLERQPGPGFGVRLVWPQYQAGTHDGVA